MRIPNALLSVGACSLSNWIPHRVLRVRDIHNFPKPIYADNLKANSSQSINKPREDVPMACFIVNGTETRQMNILSAGIRVWPINTNGGMV
jgi:hypothetical protein